jgi:NADPH:quinone reductase-like Zn-dependent oxidoreductase
LQGLRDRGRIQAGQQVLVYGASGGVGSFAVQIAKTFGADVTAVCSTRNLDQARALGADRVMDYTQEDFTQSGQRYDLIFAANGNLSIYIYRRALKPRGTFVMAGGSMRQLFQTILLGPSLSKGDQKMGTMMAQVTQPDLLFLKELLEAGKITPLIDRCYPLEQTVEAFRYLGTGHARGKVVISVGQGNA